jgi:diguanylate cyclase (GGDEF)-like protein
MRARNRWALTIAFIALAAAFYLSAGAAQSVIYVGIGALSAVAIFAGAWWRRDDRPLPWVLLGLAMLAWTMGDIAFDLLPEGFPSWADALYLAGYPLCAAALIVFVHRRIRGSGTGSMLDAAILASGAGLGAYIYVMAPIAGEVGVVWPVKVVSLAYPVADLLLLGLCARLAFSRQRVPAALLLVAGLGCLLAADLVYAHLQVTSGYEPGLLDAGWMASYALFALAAVHPTAQILADPVPEEEGPPSGTRMLLLGAATLIAPAVLASRSLRQDSLDGLVIAIVSASLFGLVTYRMAGLVRQVQRQAEQLDILSRTDPLTGALNRRAFESRLAEEMARAERDGQPLALAMLDLDRFKRFNDSHGHQAGDRLLREAVAGWSALLRTTDVLARYGGEEFVILLPSCGPGEIHPAVERLRTAIPGGQTCSAGAALWDGEESADALLGRADDLLYVAKAKGRDRTEVRPSAAMAV